MNAAERLIGWAVPPLTYTNADVALVFNASKRTIQNWAADGRLPSLRLVGKARPASSEF